MKLLATATIFLAMAMSLNASATCAFRAAADMQKKTDFSALLPSSSQPAHATTAIKATASAKAADGVRR